MIRNIYRFSSTTAKWDWGRAVNQKLAFCLVTHRVHMWRGRESFEHLLRHLLLLFLPLGRLQVEEGVDFLFLRLSIGQLQYIVIDRLRSPGGGSTDRRFSPRCITSVDWHFAGDITSCAAFSRAGSRQSTGYDRSGARDDSGVIVICYR